MRVAILPISVSRPVATTIAREDLLKGNAEVVGEYAAANAAKHSHASLVSVRIRAEGACTLLEVADDGVGGADTGTGTGLRGLWDRVAALGGTLELTSPAGVGTTLRARLPHG